MEAGLVKVLMIAQAHAASLMRRCEVTVTWAQAIPLL
jgi:hypothetical protein